MSQYAVVAPDGRRFGPTDFQTLVQWAKEGRVTPGMMVEDLLGGQTMAASAVPGLFDSPSVEAQVEYTRPAEPTGNTGLASLVLGIAGLAAWCIPFVGFGIGLSAVILGRRALNSEGRTMALVGIVLGAFCLVLSIVSLILGSMVLKSLDT